ncbi:MAG: hypothetical protein RR066_05030 [Mucinivorans sp.]
MKKIILLMTVASLLLFTRCQDEVFYTMYSFGANQFSNSNLPGMIDPEKDKACEKMAAYLISHGYVNQGLIIEGVDEKVNDKKALDHFNVKLKALQATDLSEVLKGEDGAPATVSFEYKILKGQYNKSLMATHNFAVPYVK